MTLILTPTKDDSNNSSRISALSVGLASVLEVEEVVKLVTRRQMIIDQLSLQDP